MLIQTLIDFGCRLDFRSLIQLSEILPIDIVHNLVNAIQDSLIIIINK